MFGVNVFSGSVGVRRGFFPGKKGYRLFAKPYEPGKSEDDFKKTKDAWSVYIPVRVRAMVLASDTLFAAGQPDVLNPDDPLGALEGRQGGVLLAIGRLVMGLVGHLEPEDASRSEGEPAPDPA